MKSVKPDFYQWCVPELWRHIFVYITVNNLWCKRPKTDVYTWLDITSNSCDLWHDGSLIAAVLILPSWWAFMMWCLPGKCSHLLGLKLRYFTLCWARGQHTLNFFHVEGKPAPLTPWGLCCCWPPPSMQACWSLQPPHLYLSPTMLSAGRSGKTLLFYFVSRYSRPKKKLLSARNTKY